MKQRLSQAALLSLSACLLAGCSKQSNPSAEAPPPAQVVTVPDMNVVDVSRPQLFPLATAVAYQDTAMLDVTGTVAPDVSREIPVISIASGRVLATYARYGDYVKKGQLLMEVQSMDVAGAFSNYLKAVNDERLAHVQLDRAQLLFHEGAVPKSQLEIADDGEKDAVATLNAAADQLKVLGVDKDHPTAAAKIYAPASGVIVQQNVTNAAAAGVTYAGSPNAFLIADLSHVWVICNVYENDLASVHLGQEADIHISAYPNQVFKGKISEIDALLDPNLRTANVRVQVENPGGILRLGMFATATFHGRKLATSATVPTTAVLHLHDRDWVFVPQGNAQFRRVNVQVGQILPGNRQEIQAGIAPGQQVVANALELQQTVEQ
jgi:membrane fusion protein, heavy metal efflux system